jgi:hypothetical protein
MTQLVPLLRPYEGMLLCVFENEFRSEIVWTDWPSTILTRHDP